jgi:hypothetical protein
MYNFHVERFSICGRLKISNFKNSNVFTLTKVIQIKMFQLQTFEDEQLLFWSFAHPE